MDSHLYIIFVCSPRTSSLFGSNTLARQISILVLCHTIVYIRFVIPTLKLTMLKVILAIRHLQGKFLRGHLDSHPCFNASHMNETSIWTTLVNPIMPSDMVMASFVGFFHLRQASFQGIVATLKKGKSKRSLLKHLQGFLFLANGLSKWREWVTYVFFVIPCLICC